ncbi:MAG TPA: hypothetical protein VF785_07500 [Gemmatimonadaceae bacterium]
MPYRLAHIAAVAALLPVGACIHARPVSVRVADANDPVVDEGLRRIRAATAAYTQLTAAAAAGYDTVASCIIDEHHGAMGYHHVNHEYVDDGKLDLAKPQILLYERMPDRSYKLNGVEFILPYRYWSRDSVAPVLMGQKLHHENNLNYWYLHVWAWTDNTDGLFANMNPDVHCPGGGKVYKASADSL